ncbi:sortase domain-bontaining protein [Eupransor demetentiae]|uniref:Sortase (Surface protein transpeptidase) (SrtA) n=1 Tax=Eupransor demetentiae TaxID=3109584 RepID=A0ABM9N3H4_9LACO|nr:Sortase (surface protein transpeptidase) (SrtA) [Lactobacillaceae bacterium LMG 33000]
MKLFKKWWFWLIATVVFATIGAVYVYNGLPANSPVKNAGRKVAQSLPVKQYSNKQRDEIKDKVMKNDAKKLNLTKQGWVAFPDFDIFMPIYDNAYSAAALNAGANTSQKGSTPVPTMGEGNYTLAAHNWDDGQTGFSALQQYKGQNSPYLVQGQTGGSDWLNGKKIYMANAKGIYTYTLKTQTTVDENDVAPLDVNARINGKPKLTIISCLFPNIDYRIITNAQYTDFVSWKKAPDKLIAQFDSSKHRDNTLPEGTTASGNSSSSSSSKKN